MPSNYLILCRPLLLLPSIFPSIRVFSNESVLCISNGVSASASVFPMVDGVISCQHHIYLFHPLMLVPGIPTHCRSQGIPFQNIPSTLPLKNTLIHPSAQRNQKLNQPRAPPSRGKVREKEQTCRKSVLLLSLPFWSTAGTGRRDPSKCDSTYTFSKRESTSRSTSAAPAILGLQFAFCTGSRETCTAGSLPSLQLYLAPSPHLPTLQSSFKSSNTPYSFGPQGLCTTSISLHLVNILSVGSNFRTPPDTMAEKSCGQRSLVAYNAGDTGDMDLIPGLGRYPGGGHGNPLSTNPS